MLKSAATLEDRGQLGLAAESDRLKPGTGIMRFAYATGSRPLDGYTIKRGVGVGGFGEVYFALSDAGKEVAVKRIQRNLDVEIRGVTQCLNLKHPNLVAIFDIRYDDEGQAWVVMEYVRGESLKEVIDRNPNGMPQPEVLDWFRGISSGVGYLHDHGIVHRDLKPGNVFLDESVVKLGDYGLSKYISCSRRSGQTESVGTFHYMAPEIGRGIYGKEIDVYALGIILYEMHTGRVPFEGESSHEIIMKHLTAAPDVTPLPEKLRPVVQRALFKDPEKRYRGVPEMAVAVEAAIGRPTGRATFVAQHAAAASAQSAAVEDRTFYVGPEEETDGIYLGPVKQIAGAEPVVNARPVATSREEPVAKAVRDGFAQIVRWWNSPSLNQAGRIVLGVVLAILFLLNTGWILPLAVILGSMYLVYYGIRAIVLSISEPQPVKPTTTPFRPSPPAAPAPTYKPVVPNTPAAATATVPVAVVTPTRPRPHVRKRKRWHEVACDHLKKKTPGERIMELTGSMLMSAIVIAVVSFLVLIIAGQPVNNSVGSWTNFAWLSLTSLAGTWSLLIPAKLWEGVEGDAVRRRFFLILLGLGVGAVAFGLDQYLGPNLTPARIIDTPQVWKAPNGFGRDGSPQMPAYVVYFAGLFLALRWWQQANPLRASRFSFWTTFGTVAVALVWQIFWPFPQPWGLMVPAIMSIALQLSAPWISTSARSEFRKAAEA